MEEDDKACLMVRMAVSGWMFLLVPAHPYSLGQRAVKWLGACVCLGHVYCTCIPCGLNLFRVAFALSWCWLMLSLAGQQSVLCALQASDTNSPFPMLQTEVTLTPFWYYYESLYSPIMTAQHTILQHYAYKNHKTQTTPQLKRLIRI